MPLLGGNFDLIPDPRRDRRTRHALSDGETLHNAFPDRSFKPGGSPEP